MRKGYLISLIGVLLISGEWLLYHYHIINLLANVVTSMAIFYGVVLTKARWGSYRRP
jgi:hypothetical protein